MTVQALEGLRVVELGQGLAAAYCGRQFALWGAEVALIEPEGGSPLRGAAPRVATAAGDVSLLWDYVAAGKRSILPPADGAALTDLLARADVLVVDKAAQTLAPLGLTTAGLHAALPDLVVVDMSAFGLEGPLAGLEASEIVVQAMAGYVHHNGQPGRPPLKAPGHILAYACGVSAFVAATAAAVGRLNGGGGALIEASELEAISSFIPLLRSQYMGLHYKRSGGPNTGVRFMACKDGHVSFIVPTPKQAPEYGQALGIADADWPAITYEPLAEGRAAALYDFMAQYTARLTEEEAFLGMLRAGHPCGRAANPGSVLADPHLAARGFFKAVTHPVLGEIAMPGPAAHLSRTPAAGFGPAPAAPEPAEALSWAGASAFARPRTAPKGRKPLAGLKLLDLTQAWIGPYAAMLLADLGADTIKIESHKRPDVWRQLSANPIAVTDLNAKELNISPNYNSANTNKRSLCLNFKTEAGKALFLRLAADADLVMENFTPRVLERMGLDHAALSQANPRLVMTSFCGFGKTGPLSDYKANGASIEGICGWDYFHRYPDGEPMVMGFYQADAITGLQMAASTLVALFHQARTGEGQALDGSMYEAAAGYIGEALLEAQFGQRQTPFGNRDADAAPTGVYPCLGEDRWVAVSVLDDGQWRALAGVIPELAEPRFAAAPGRLAAVDELDARLAAWTATRAAEDAMTALQDAGVPAGLVRSPQEILDCPQFAGRGWFRRLHHAELGEHSYNGLPWRFAGVEPGPHTASPRLGEHSRVLLRERLGLSDAEIEALIEADVTGAVAEG